MAIQIKINTDPKQFLPLFKAAGSEVGIDYAISPDWIRYGKLIESGDYLFVGAFDGSLPVGYIGIMFSSQLFNADVVHAIVDSFFVIPEYRMRTVAGLLLAKAMPKVKAVANRINFQCAGESQLAGMLIRRGFRHLDNAYEKVLS